MKQITVNYRNKTKSYTYDIVDNITLDVKFKNSYDMCKGRAKYENWPSTDFAFAWHDYGTPEDWSNEDGEEIPYSDYISEVLAIFFETKQTY